MTNMTVLDGGTGTEIEKLLSKLPANQRKDLTNDCWVGAMQLYHPEIVKQVHQKYLASGAKIITANTYATNRHLLDSAGIGHRTEEAVNVACKLAREARAESFSPDDVKIAGSIACHPPKMTRVNGVYRGQFPSREQQKADFSEVFRLLCENSVDMIFLELMKDLEHSPLVMEAVAESMAKMESAPPPVYLCLAARFSKDAAKTLCLFSTIEDIPLTGALLKNWISIFTDRGVSLAGINIMHTNFSVVGPTIDVIQSVYPGPVGCYPDHGFFKVPEWVFEEIDLGEAMRFVEAWVEKGVWMVGGCCGVGPDFIAAVAERNFQVKDTNVKH